VDGRGPAWIPAAWFAGLTALLAQVALVRELLVVFFGHELTLGLMFGVWLASVALGSVLGRALVRRLVSPERLARAASLGLALLAMLSVPLLFSARGFRLVFATPAGELVPFGFMLAGCTLVLAPACIVIGLLFPCFCQGAASHDARSVARVYAADACGSLAGGLAFTFVLVRWASALACMVLISAAALASAACLVRGRVRILAMAAVAGLIVLAAWPGALAPAERLAAVWRWRAFGILGRAASSDSPRLVAERESRYQSLALLESSGQATVYGNGQVLFSVPDPLAAEFAMHRAMAQNPAARRVLLVGGNPADDVRELLRYPLDSLVHVDLDEAVPRLFTGLPRDPRLVRIAMDGPRYMQTATNFFDVILVQAPAPVTVGLNRYYTVEFYESVRRRLTPAGYFTTVLEASEHLHDDTALLAASIWRTLGACFPDVRVTAGPMVRFYAGTAGSGLTLDAVELTARSQASGVRGDYFRSEFLEQDEALAPDRIAWTRERLEEVDAPVNTGLRPVAFRYSLVLWSRFSGSGLEPILRRLNRVSFGPLPTGVLLVGLALAAAGVFRRLAGRRDGWRWPTIMALTGLTVSGFTAMALHLMILVHFQNRLGYMYAHLGLLGAAFMAGLAAGAWSVQGVMVRGIGPAIRIMLAMQVLMVVAALVLLVFAEHDTGLADAGVPAWVLEGVLTGLAAVTGGLAGARFPAGCEWLKRQGVSPGAAAAWANAADLVGSAAGSLVTGVVLLSVFGLGDACRLLVALQIASALAVVSGAMAINRHSSVNSET
jgi:spermidine synthase